MVNLTTKEKQALLILFKDFTSFYNANSISKILNISHVGAQKIFKRLLNENLLMHKKIGKSIIYKLNIKDDYTNQLLTFLLIDEANNFKRWKEEFKKLSQKNVIVMIFGSAIKNYSKAKDIDLMIILNKKNEKEVNAILKEKEKILPKKLHAIKLTSQDLLKNLKKQDKITIDIIKDAIILFGQNKYIEIMQNVTGF